MQVSEASERLLEVRGLTLHRGTRRIIDGVDLSLERGQTLALVGESGAGKTTIAVALMGLLKSQEARIDGSARFGGVPNLFALHEREWTRLRGRHLAMVFQDASAALNPCFTIGRQLCSVLRRQLGLGRRLARARAIELLDSVGINDPEARLTSYPHELSGGMQQRVMVAIALSCNPEVLFADEPTSALDVTIQAQIIRLILEQSRERQASCIFVLHDLALASQSCDRIVVLYAGQVMEAGPSEIVLSRPLHPYTKLLKSCVLEIGTKRLDPPSGTVPSFEEMPRGCRFATRCPRALESCMVEKPPLSQSLGRAVACWNPE